jgi:hypothetical protein
MRWLAYILIVIGLIFVADAAYDEHRGVADALSPGRGSRRHIVACSDDPEQFRNLMTYQWVRGPLFLVGGFIILGFCRRADRLDPFSPDFAGSDALDDLNRTLTEEEQRRHRPIK